MRPSTELAVILTDANGTTKTLDSNAPDPGDRPRGLQFGTQLGSGFYGGGYSLARRIDQENEDHAVLDDAKFVGADGDTAYEAYITDLPRSMDSTHTLSVTLAGWIGHAADEPFTEIFVDRDLGAWRGAGNARRVALLGLGVFGQVNDPTATTDQSGVATLKTAVADTWAAGKGPICEAWYDAGDGNQIAAVSYEWTRGINVPAGPDSWVWDIGLSTDDVQTAIEGGADLQAAGPGAGTLTHSPTTPDKRFAFLDLYTTAAGGVAGTEYAIDWRKLAVYGDQGLPLIGTATPYGVAASDVIKYLAGRYCPLLNTSGVQTTTYPISHLTFREHTKPYDAFLKVNSYHLWQQLAVWEDRTLHYAPIDLDDWDWEIRHDDVGNQIGLQGDSIANRRSGIIVTFTNAATGQPERLHPRDYPELRDDSIDNPYTSHGRRGYGEPHAVPFPTTRNDALQLGRVKLAEDNQASGPGSFTCQHHVRDRAGNWQPAWKVRAGDRIRLTSSVTLSDRPRLIHETSYVHDARTVTISVDTPLRYLEGYVDRVLTAMTAANLT